MLNGESNPGRLNGRVGRVVMGEAVGDCEEEGTTE